MLKRINCGQPLSLSVVSDSEVLVMFVKGVGEYPARKFSEEQKFL